MADQSCSERSQLLLNSRPMSKTTRRRDHVVTLVIFAMTFAECSLVRGNNFVTASTVEQLNMVDDQSGSSATDTSAWRADQHMATDGDGKHNSPLDTYDDMLVYQSAATGEDGSSLQPHLSTPSRGRLHQPESRRASSSGLRLIGLGKRPSGSTSSSGSPLRYIGLGRKRASPLRYIGIGRRGGQEPVDDYTAGGSKALSSGDTDSTQGGQTRRRRNVGMRLIGLGRRSGFDSGSDSMTSSALTDEDDYSLGDGYRLRDDVGQQWRHVKRAAGSVDKSGYRRVQLRRWSSASGSNVDPALLRLGIGK